SSAHTPTAPPTIYTLSLHDALPIFRKELERARGQQKVHATEVELHQIRSQIDQVYFGILLSRQQSKTIELLIENLKEQLSTVRSKVKNGVLLPSQQHILEAELIKARQDSAESRSNTTAGYQVLSELIGEEVTVNTNLALPKAPPDYRSLQPQRPELLIFASNQKVLEQRKKL